jgi:metallo-beta-lactamase family protein
MKIRFIGATETVTGSKHLIITEKGRQVLLDCGLYQGAGKETGTMNRHLGLNPLNIDAVLLSHAHIDHSGSLPLLVREGFNGWIYCTPATYDVCSILLLDSAAIHEADVSFINKQRRKRKQPPVEPLYTVGDAERCLKRFKPIPFDTDFQLSDELSFYFSENGHIIGSAAINITAHEEGQYTRLTFTGDIVRYSDPLLKPPGVFRQADYIICESTYGDRLHETSAEAEQIMLDIVRHTCIEKKGKLVIPAFSLGRTQEILYILDGLTNRKLLPPVKVYVDSPLSTKATKIVRSHPESFNEALREYIKSDPDPFGFPQLRYVEDHDESRRLNELSEPCVIISASGMADAGRIKHHLRHTISDARNTVLISGYCSPHTLGARLLSGDRQVRIFGDLFEVNAEVRSLLSLSAHADYSEMLRYLSCQRASSVKKIFLVHGEEHSKESFAARLREAGFPDVVIPRKGETFEVRGTE